jgi:FkbM family methyltransferase
VAEGSYHEASLREIQNLFKTTPKTWGWVNGMFLGGNDDLITLRFLRGLDYEPHTRKIWRELSKNAEWVVDVGSHSGLFTIEAFRSGAKKVLSAEPNPINYSRLVLNLRYNGFSVDNAYFGAIGDQNTVQMLAMSNLTFCNAAGSLYKQGNIKIPVRVVRLDTLLAKDDWPKVKVLKIDAENATPQVLRGMGGILEHKPDIILECTQDGMEEILKPCGYNYWKIWEDGRLEESDLKPFNPDNNYNGTHEDCRNRLCSVKGL